MVILYLLATVVNVINWKVCHCEWDKPYQR